MSEKTMEVDTLIRGDVRVEWERLGEGVCGDYNPDDPDDIELLRFDVSHKDSETGEWLAVDDASYCTQVPVDTAPEVRQTLLRFIMDEVYEPVTDGHSIKKLCERLSWISPEASKQEDNHGGL